MERVEIFQQVRKPASGDCQHLGVGSSLDKDHKMVSDCEKGGE
jgi:hypothetical protein